MFSHVQSADDADDYLPENDEQPKPPIPSVTVPSVKLEETKLEDVAYSDKRALTPSSPTDLDTSV